MEEMEFPAPVEGIVLTHFVVSANVAASLDFYVRVLGGVPVMDGEPSIVKLANSWIIINVVEDRLTTSHRSFLTYRMIRIV